MRSVLVVDDEIGIREFLKIALTRRGYDVVTTAYIEQALEELAKKPFDVVVLDAHLHGALGADLIRRVRSSKNPVPVLVYTGHVTPEEENEFREAGACDVVLKGGGVDRLLERVAAAVESSPVAPASAPIPSARTVLVTDDDAAVRRVLVRFLQSRHFAVVEADSGRAAVEAVKSGRFNAVFLDVNMPGDLDGLEALREIRALRPDTAVIMVSGDQDDHTVGRAVELGAAGYVVKPFDFLYLEMILMSKITG